MKNLLCIQISFAIGFFFFPTCGMTVYETTMDNLTLDEIIELGDFNNRCMKTVRTILSGQITLSNEQLNQLVESKVFKKLHSLNLSRQGNLTDDHISKLANNPNFS